MKKERFFSFLIVLLGLLVQTGGAITSQMASKTGEDHNVVAKLNQYLKRALTGQWQLSCTEKIQREESRYEVVLTKRSTGENARRWDLRKTDVNKATYEYRLRLKGKKINEKRLSLSAQNELLYDRKDTGSILPYNDRNIIFNPMEYLSRMSRGMSDYQVEGRERRGDIEAWVVRFKSMLKAGERTVILAGKVWVHPETGAVMRLTLDPATWSFFENEVIPKEFAAVPALGHAALRRAMTWEADFGAEDRGIRFPSSIGIKEEYDDGSGEFLKANVWTISFEGYQFAPGLPTSASNPGHPVLKKAGSYCERLKTIALQYICDERIVRTSYLYNVRTFVNGSEIGAVSLPQKKWDLKRKATREVVYDYQLLKKADQLQEKRKALMVDGKTWTKTELPPNILPYQAQYIVYGPVGFLSDFWQTRFDYFEQGEETLGDKKTLVFISQPNEFREDNSVYGRVWVETNTGAVLQIAWDPESIDFFRAEDTPKAFGGLEKQLIWTAYFEVEKNGIYFPSRQEIREEYVGPKGETIVADSWTITYENYRFFTVGTDVEIKK